MEHGASAGGRTSGAWSTEHPPGGGQVGHGASAGGRTSGAWSMEHLPGGGQVGHGARGMGQGNIYLPDETKLKYKN